MTAFLDVETADFADAARSMYDDVAQPVSEAVSTLAAALEDSAAMAGNDPGGQAWAAPYDKAARAAVQAGQDVGNGCFRLAAMFTQSARNYEAADAASSGRTRPAVTGPLPDDTYFSVGGAPPSAAGGSGGGPPGWGLVQHAVGYVWPDGHQDRLHSAAGSWDRAAAVLEGHAFEAALAVIQFPRDHLPEADDMITVCQGMNGHLRELGGVYRSLASACRDLAHHIDSVHSDVIHELAELLAESALIQTAGAALSFFTLGAAEAPTQVLEGARIAAVVARVKTLFEAFFAAARAVANAIETAFERIDRIAAEVRSVLHLKVIAATTSLGRRYPRIAALVAERAAMNRLVNDAGQVILVKFGAKTGQLERKFGHAADFGVDVPRGRRGFDVFEDAIKKFLASPSVARVRGAYRGDAAILTFDPARRLLVIQHLDGTFWTGFRMTKEQLDRLVSTGRIGIE